MTVQDLIDELNKIQDKTLLISVEADHGQIPIKASHVGEAYVEDINDYMMELVAFSDDQEALDAYNVDEENKIVIIQGY